MKQLFLVAALFLAACATAAPVIVNAEPQPVEQAQQTAPLTVEGSFPVTCMRGATFNLVTGPREEIMTIEDEIQGLRVDLHVATFMNEETSVVVVYHTFETRPDVYCVLHAAPASGMELPLEGLT